MIRFASSLALTAFLVSPAAIAQPHAPTKPHNTGAISPSTTNNDDSCDISLLPAATLLLPYFAVDYSAPPSTAQTTLFTVTNVTRTPQIARVTLWSEWAYPVLAFNLFLTGYDVQAINLYDVLARGIIAPGNGSAGTSNETQRGSLSLPNEANSHFLSTAPASCSNLPGVVPAAVLESVRNALTGRALSSCGLPVSGFHLIPTGTPRAFAAGYATIDLVATCSSSFVNDRFGLNELLFDNVLTGDYQQVSPDSASGNYAGGSPLVHIRAVPEGGNAGEDVATNLPYTFYDRFTSALPGTRRTFDRRQPLPSTFAARAIEGGSGSFDTNLKIWREAISSGTSQNCADYAANRDMSLGSIVRFDEHENPTALASGVIIVTTPSSGPTLPAASSTRVGNDRVFPSLPQSGDVGGRIYLELNNGGGAEYSANPHGVQPSPYMQPTLAKRQSQNWAVVSMSAEGRYSVDYDAVAMGNGCSPAPLLTEPIGPSANANP